MRALLFGAALLLALGVARVSAETDAGERQGNPPSIVYTDGVRGSLTDLRATNMITYAYYLPVMHKTPVCDVTGETYNRVAVISPPANPGAEINPDLNLTLRGYVGTIGELSLIDFDHPIDASAPQLYTLFSDQRTPTFRAVYQVYDWNWYFNARGALLTDPPVTLVGMATSPGELIRVPVSGYDIGRRATGYAVMVLYASNNRITLKYTREDNVVYGYTIHLENVCVDPRLLALYDALNAAGRAQLPALYAGQAVGRASVSELGVAIRDTGMFMDPRWRADWWQGR